MTTHLGEAPPDERWISTLGTPLAAQLRDFARDDVEAEAMLGTYTVFQQGIHGEMVRPFPGAAAVIRELTSRGSRVAVVTSKRGGVARRTMEACGLWDAVDLLVSADGVSRGKPDLEPVLKALEVLGLERCPEEVVVVGRRVSGLLPGEPRGGARHRASHPTGPHSADVAKSICSASFRSFSVMPPASCVESVSVTVA